MSDAKRASVHAWDELGVDRPMARLERRRVIGEWVMISHVTLEKGFTVAVHAHENEQFACVLSGRIRFSLPEEGREVTLTGGEVLHLPANVPHGAEALERTVILDVFSPPSEKTGVDAAVG